MNWKTYKFHCSALPRLMTNSRTKSEPLGETAKSLLREIHIKEIFGREKTDSINRYTQKGLLVEQDSLDLATKVLDTGFIAKNKDQLENDYIIGTPDVVKPETWDVKSNWDLWTFFEVDEDKACKDYFWQVFGYMWLTDAKQTKLIYALVNTPDHIVEDELYRLNFKVGEDKAEEYRKNFVFDDIPPEKRIKTFTIDWESEKLEELTQRIELAREYLGGLSL